MLACHVSTPMAPKVRMGREISSPASRSGELLQSSDAIRTSPDFCLLKRLNCIRRTSLLNSIDSTSELVVNITAAMGRTGLEIQFERVLAVTREYLRYTVYFVVG